MRPNTIITSFFSIGKLTEFLDQLHNLPTSEEDVFIIVFSIFTVMDFLAAIELHGSQCPHCGGTLNQAHYPVKTSLFGISEQTAQESGLRVRFSFSCSQCRKRVLAPSIRFENNSSYCKLSHFIIRVFQKNKGEWKRGELRELSRKTKIPLDTLKYLLGKESTETKQEFIEKLSRRLINSARFPISQVRELPQILVASLDSLEKTKEFFCSFPLVLFLVVPQDSVRVFEEIFDTHFSYLNRSPPTSD